MLAIAERLVDQTVEDSNGYAKAIDDRTLHVSRGDITDILQTANGADSLFMHQHINCEQKTTKEFYDTAGGIENNFKQRSRHTTHPSINIDVPTVARQPEFGNRAYDLYGNKKFYLEEKDEYVVYRNDRQFARDLDGHTIPVHTTDIRRLLERDSRDEPAYICLPEHASSFTQTQLVPEIYTKDEINEMFYGVYGEHERNKEAFQMKLDGVYYPLNDSISCILEIFGASTRDDHRDRLSVDIGDQESIDTQDMVSIDSKARRKPVRDPNGYAKAIDGRTLHVCRGDIADILQTANGADNLFMHQQINREQKTIKEFYDTAGVIENNFKQQSRHTAHPSINIDVPTVTRQPEFGKRTYDLYGNRKFYWEDKDEYGVYRDDRQFARDVDGHTISVHTTDIRRLLETAS
ncbi:hypothetical protein F2Q69_00006418 [Brassica cretica]|uniref:Uncharacterized protein n=1 Tax=Brassica cretica TaxID=69181 RepID=A0A8S9P316_BRACR|nr:hypothetical protein F2Q69_00006418 [Brassica cretica]